MAHDGQTSINIPQLIAVAVVGFLAIRWFMSKPSQSSGTRPTLSSRRNAVDPSKILQVSAVFPQLDQRSIAWDLQRNGGNVEATTERILGGRGLETPPPSYQPTNLPTPAATQQSSTSGSKTNAAALDLITRYGLQSKVDGKGKEPVPSEEQRKGGWSADKVARADALKRRREEMILAARRRMEEKGAQA